MADVRFYHLVDLPLDKVLPRMLQQAVERGWRSVVEARSEARVEELCELLWTFDDATFLPHGSKSDGTPELQPVWLTAGPDNPNRATVRFYVDGARPGDTSGQDRTVVIFDGREEQAVSNAREDWKRFRGAGHDVSYWQQDGDGRWRNAAG